ncbi:hypothetical protein TRVL_02371 [Trypanosoma vivax]|nr:hypothetical protein TRVL_02371 [Trypanosoma vivax]
MKSRRQRRRERQMKISKTKRGQREKRRIRKATERRCAREVDSHTTALMQSYALRRIAERDRERTEAKKSEKEENSTHCKNKSDDECEKLPKKMGRQDGVGKRQQRSERIKETRTPKLLTRSLY